MKKKLLILLLTISSFVASAEEYWCPKCQAEVLADDVFCPSCRYRLKDPSSSVSASTQEPTFVPQYQYDYTSSPSQGGLPFYQGMGRGLVTVCSSPIECLRLICVTWTGGLDGESSGAGTKSSGGSSINGGDLGVLGAALAAGVVAGITTVGLVAGTVSAVGDVGVGTLDFLTFGVVGDAVWKDGNKSPYFWQRRWSGRSRGWEEVGGAIF